MVCGDPRLREIVLEFRDSVRVGSSRVGGVLRKLYPILSLYVILSLVFEGRGVVRVLWDRASAPLAMIVIAGACIAPILAAYLAFHGYLTLEARRRLRAPVVTRPHNPTLLLLPFLLALLRPDYYVHHWPETRVALAYLYAGCALSPTLALAVMWVLRTRVVWCWKRDLDEEVLERFVEGLPDGRYVPGSLIPYASNVGTLAVAIAVDAPSLTPYLITAGTLSVLALTTYISTFTEGDLLDILGKLRSGPWRDDSYVIGFTILILERSFWLIIEHSHP
ncbi:Uncharacterized membrane protein specific for M.kandleri, MK-26 family [Methanopyrus kandleri AV19]|uniref:Uncharacterized membrane protein specific for M.kandleri, MK-26 family n=1 Tax=Methanopyrus kandleri (strain AV19 / DSM 6324 / JCM 9639 / NBRC 100938) TaxID=190192 RepID=Q8TW77_METKA|nr:Uncharacterized membrane protein specific for M.kandleri, MK-26 family [Methanopyrus kandleri AV19]